MAEAQRECARKIARINLMGKPLIVGLLRESCAIPMIEAPFAVKRFNEENGTDVKLIDHRALDGVLRSDELGEVREGFPSVSSSAIAFESPGQRLGGVIVSGTNPSRSTRDRTLLILETKGYRGERDIALVATGITADDFQINERLNTYTVSVPEERLIAVPDFPRETGLYNLHAGSGIPHGEKVEPSDEARKFFFWGGEACVKFLTLASGDGRNVSYWAYHDQGEAMSGLVVEVPEKDIGRFESIDKPAAGSGVSDPPAIVITPEDTAHPKPSVGGFADKLRSFFGRRLKEPTA